MITSIRCRINLQDNRNTLSKNNTSGSRRTSQKRFMRFEPHKNVAEILFQHDSVQTHTILKNTGSNNKTQTDCSSSPTIRPKHAASDFHLLGALKEKTEKSMVMIPPLWSSGQSFWLQIQRSRVRFPALPDFSE